MGCCSTRKKCITICACTAATCFDTEIDCLTSSTSNPIRFIDLIAREWKVEMYPKKAQGQGQRREPAVERGPFHRNPAEFDLLKLSGRAIRSTPEEGKWPLGSVRPWHGREREGKSASRERGERERAREESGPSLEQRAERCVPREQTSNEWPTFELDSSEWAIESRRPESQVHRSHYRPLLLLQAWRELRDLPRLAAPSSLCVCVWTSQLRSLKCRRRRLARLR